MAWRRQGCSLPSCFHDCTLTSRCVGKWPKGELFACGAFLGNLCQKSRGAEVSSIQELYVLLFLSLCPLSLSLLSLSLNSYLSCDVFLTLQKCCTCYTICTSKSKSAALVTQSVHQSLQTVLLVPRNLRLRLPKCCVIDANQCREMRVFVPMGPGPTRFPEARPRMFLGMRRFFLYLLVSSARPLRLPLPVGPGQGAESGMPPHLLPMPEVSRPVLVGNWPHGRKMLRAPIIGRAAAISVFSCRAGRLLPTPCRAP